VRREQAMKTILLVDDSKNIREYCRAALEEDGYHVVLGTDGLEAVAAVCERVPDVVILDICMPRMGGLETLERLAAMAPEIPVILFTAYDEDCLQDHRSRLASACIEKDADLSELKRTIRQVLGALPAEPRGPTLRRGRPPEHVPESRGAETEHHAV
jgi:two-component system, NarL family, response regulator EvgA